MVATPRKTTARDSIVADCIRIVNPWDGPAAASRFKEILAPLALDVGPRLLRIRALPIPSKENIRELLLPTARHLELDLKEILSSKLSTTLLIQIALNSRSTYCPIQLGF